MSGRKKYRDGYDPIMSLNANNCGDSAELIDSASSGRTDRLVQNQLSYCLCTCRLQPRPDAHACQPVDQFLSTILVEISKAIKKIFSTPPATDGSPFLYGLLRPRGTSASRASTLMRMTTRVERARDFHGTARGIFDERFYIYERRDEKKLQ